MRSSINFKSAQRVPKLIKEDRDGASLSKERIQSASQTRMYKDPSLRPGQGGSFKISCVSKSKREASASINQDLADSNIKIEES